MLRNLAAIVAFVMLASLAGCRTPQLVTSREQASVAMNLVRVNEADAPVLSPWELEPDHEFAFAVQGYGPDGGLRPGVYVQERSTGRWFELASVSTEGGTFGRAPSDDDVRLAVGWDYRHLADHESVELPLRTSGSVNLPQRVLHEVDCYVFRFNERGVPADAMTELRVRKADLRRAIAARSQR